MKFTMIARLSRLMMAVLVSAWVASSASASVWLSSYSFAPNNLPTINSNDSLTSMYKLRAKVNGVQYENKWNDNGQKIDSAPAPGTYSVALYYLQYDSTGTNLLTIGPQTTQTLTILSPVNGVNWNGIYMPSTATPGSTINFPASVTNTGNTLWDGNYYLELKDAAGNHLNYPSLATTPPGSSISPSFSLTVPSTAGVYTYYFTAMQYGVQYFGPTQSASITVNTNPTTSLSLSSTSITVGQSVTATSTTTDPDGNLINQAIDYLPPGASSWVSGTSTNGFRWDGGPTSSNTVSNSIVLNTVGTWQFRARGADNLGGISNFSTVNVTVANLGPAPVTTLTAAYGGSSTTGNTNAGGPPTQSVPSGGIFTMTSYTTDGDNNLTSQQFDLSSDGGNTWSLGNSGNSRLWTGGPTGSNSLSKNFQLGDGRYRFRGYGTDAQNQTSVYQYVDVLVGNAPTFTTQPSGATVNVGSSVTFSVATAGTAPITYQWQKNGVNISGATSTSYMISSVQTSDAATYRVIATNMIGTATSNGAVLTVNNPPPPPPPAPSITSPLTASGAVGTPFSYTITASNSPTGFGASGLPSWLTIAGSVISGTPPMAGSYSVTILATNAGGTGSATLTINIGGATGNSSPLGLNVHRPGN
jgi:hypothetical protein